MALLVTQEAADEAPRWSIVDIRRVGHPPLLPLQTMPLPPVVEISSVLGMIRYELPSLHPIAAVYLDDHALTDSPLVTADAMTITLMRSTPGPHAPVMPPTPGLDMNVDLMERRTALHAHFNSYPPAPWPERLATGDDGLAPSSVTEDHTDSSASFHSGSITDDLDNDGSLSLLPPPTTSSTTTLVPANYFGSTPTTTPAPEPSYPSVDSPRPRACNIVSTLLDVADAHICVFAVCGHCRPKQINILTTMPVADVLSRFTSSFVDEGLLPEAAHWILSQRAHWLHDGRLALFLATGWGSMEPFYSSVWVEPGHRWQTPYMVSLPLHADRQQVLARISLPHVDLLVITVNGVIWDGAARPFHNGDVMQLRSTWHRLGSLPAHIADDRVLGLAALQCGCDGPIGFPSLQPSLRDACIHQHFATWAETFTHDFGPSDHLNNFYLVVHGGPFLRVSVGTRLPPARADVQAFFDEHFFPTLGSRTVEDSHFIWDDTSLFFARTAAYPSDLWLLLGGPRLDCIQLEANQNLSQWPAPPGLVWYPSETRGNVGIAFLQPIRPDGRYPTTDNLANLPVRPPHAMPEPGSPVHTGSLPSGSHSLRSIFGTSSEGFQGDFADLPASSEGSHVDSSAEAAHRVVPDTSTSSSSSASSSDSAPTPDEGVLLLQTSTAAIKAPAPSGQCADTRTSTECASSAPARLTAAIMRNIPTPMRAQVVPPQPVETTPPTVLLSGAHNSSLCASTTEPLLPHSSRLNAHQVSPHIGRTTLLLEDCLPQAAARTHNYAVNRHMCADLRGDFALCHLSRCVPTTLQLPPCARQLLQGTPPWKGQPLQALSIYTDGSFRADPSSASWAIAVFGRDDTGCWLWCGFRGGPLTAERMQAEGLSPYPAEVCAMAVALATIYAAQVAEAALFFDATAAQGVVSCVYRMSTPTPLQASARSLYLLNLCAGCRLFFLHTPSHRGNPGNELADSLTHLAHEADPSAARELEDFLLHPEIGRLWIVHDSSYALPALGEDGVAAPQISHCYPLPPTSNPIQMAQHLPPSAPTSHLMHLCACTYNTLSLKNRLQQQALASLFMEQGCQVVGLQETRISPDPVTKYGPYTAFAGPAVEGTEGCQLWIDFNRPVATDVDGEAIRFEFRTFMVHAAHPTYLVVSGDAGHLRFLFVVAHAPTSKHSCIAIQTWWSQLGRAIQAAPHGRIPIFLFDANAHFEPAMAVPTVACNENARQFIALTERHALTISALQDASGHPIVSWISPNGDSFCIDFLAIPDTWQRCMHTFQVRDFSDRYSGIDHQPVFLAIRAQLRGDKQASFRISTRVLGSAAGQQAIAQAWRTMPAIPWHVDVDRHLSIINEHLQHHLRHVGAEQRHPRAPAIGAATWSLLRLQRHHRRILRRMRQAGRRYLLQALFGAWRGNLPAAAVQQRRRACFRLHMRGCQIADSLRQLKCRMKRSFEADHAAFCRKMIEQARDNGTSASPALPAEDRQEIQGPCRAPRPGGFFRHSAQ